MKKKTIFILLLIFAVISIKLIPDDKELFMGVNAGINTIKANVMFLLDDSVSMRNGIIFYPKDGLDGIAGNDDDGYDKDNKAKYTIGTIYNNIQSPRVAETSAFSYLQIDATHIKYLYEGEGSSRSSARCVNVATDWITLKGGKAKRRNFVVGQWIFDTYHGARAKIEEKIKINNNRFKLRISNQGPGLRRIGEANVSVPNQQNVNMYCLADVKAVSGDTIVINKDSYDMYLVGWWIADKKTGAIAQIKSKDGGSGDDYQLTLSNKTDDFAVGSKVSGTEVLAGQKVISVLLYADPEIDYQWYGNEYIKWFVFYAGDFQREAISYFSKYGTFDVNIEPKDTPSHQNNACGQSDAGGTLLKRKVWTKIQILREVACQVANDNYKKVKMGMFRFNGKNGGKLVKDIEDLDDTTGEKLKAFNTEAYNLKANSSTPLAEALADIWRYYKPDSEANWENKNYKLISSTFDPHNSPMEAWCQKNFVIIITDGKPADDDFDNSRWSTNDSLFSKYQVRRLQEYKVNEDWETWAADPSTNGWGSLNDSGKPYLDDVAYYLAHQDMFPDKLYPTWKNDQNIITYVIGFAKDLPILQKTGDYGLGGYYTASNYEDLSAQLNTILSDIDLKAKGFSSITAPRKTTSAGSKDNVSFVGFFIPSATQSLWEGHLKSYKIIEKWGFDENNDGIISAAEYTYTDRAVCNTEAAKDNQLCTNTVSLSTTESWDSADKFSSSTTARKLFYNNGTTIKPLTSLSDEDASYRSQVFNEVTDVAETNNIEAKLYEHVLGDIFHSETTFLGSPNVGKIHLSKINPKECNGTPSGLTKCYQSFYNANKSRQGVIYVGSNDGIFHMINADINNGGNELWGFVPDEVMPNIKKNYKTPVHHYTVDGAIKIDDIFYRGSVSPSNVWKTILCFGLRRGGNAYYTLDVTTVGNKPKLLWKFKDSKYSGQSFAKPKIVQMKFLDTNGDPEKRWVVILAGGFAFNDENKNDSKGKSVFIVDASTGELIWMIGYDKDGAVESGTLISTTPDTNDSKKHLTSSEYFNYSIPSAISTVDIDNDGVVNFIYFGNKAGHLFKLNVENPDTDNWTTNILYKSKIISEETDSITITKVNIQNVSSPEKIELTLDFALGKKYIGRNIIAMDDSKTTYASAVITNIEGDSNTKISVTLTSDATFSKTTSQKLYIKTWAPIYLNPAVFYDAGYKLWVAFGTGDKDRPKTNPVKGKIIAIIDNGTYGITQPDIVNLKTGAVDLNDVTKDGLVWSQFENTTMETSTLKGLYYEFEGDKEKMYDPDPIVLPDEDSNPHIIFNTYRPDESASGGGGSTTPDPCETKHDNIMTIYDLAISPSATNPNKTNATMQSTGGRTAGGGMFGGGGEYVEFIGSGQAGSIPPVVKTKKRKIGYPGKLIFWKEKKR